MLGLHKHILDFEILETDNLKTLVFVDSSQYMDEPDRPLLEVILPGHTKYFLVNVTAKNVNTFNSSTLGLNKALVQSEMLDLPDGIWHFKYKICPYKYVFVIKSVMRVSLLLNKLKSLYQKLDLTECNSKEAAKIDRELTRIHVLIEGARAEANNDPEKASDYYNLADRMIQKQLDKLCKSC